MTAAEAELREIAGDDPGANEIVDLFLRTKAEVEAALAPLTWADAEIDAAVERHPEAWDVLWHARPYLHPAPGFAFPATEFVWRGHFRELLDRAAAGEDLRPATNAEICMLGREASALAPLTTAAAGLYFRAWLAAFPDRPVWDGHAEEVEHGRKMNDWEITELERQAREAVARRNPARRLPRDLTCDGRHDGREVACRFIPGTLDGQPAPSRTARPARKPAVAAHPAPSPAGGELTLFDMPGEGAS
jgi:hypothetical protein